MSEEFNDAQEALNEGNPGQADGTANDTPDQPTATQSVDLDELPEFRNWKSKMDSRQAQLEREKREAERKAAAAQAAYEEIMGVIDQDSPEGRTLIENVRLAERQAALEQKEREIAEFEQRRQQERQIEQYRANVRQRASSMGMDPFNPDLSRAIEQALQSGSGAPVENVFIEYRAKQLASEMTGQQQQQPTPESQPQRPARSSALPPTGGHPRTTRNPARLEEISIELQELYRQPTKHEQRIKALKKERDALLE